MSDFSDVGAFQNQFGFPVSGSHVCPPTESDATTRDARLRFILAEVRELAEAYGYDLTYTLLPPAPDHGICLPHVARELVDIVYVALGTAHFHNLPWSRIFKLVHRANMRKIRDVNGAQDEKFGVIKPPGWVPPDIVGQLAASGWPGPPLFQKSPTL